MRMPQGSFVNGSSVAIRTVFVAGFVLKTCLACTVFDAGVAVKLPRGSFVNASSTASTVFDAGVALKMPQGSFVNEASLACMVFDAGVALKML